MNQTRVSVVIPTFNRPEATARAVRSALAQTRPVAEIIVVDDASLPPLAPEALGVDDARLTILRHSRNEGASSARQTGIAAATGSVVAFLDSDDRWLPGKLAAQLPLIEGRTDELVAVACGWAEEGERYAARMPIGSSDPADFASGCWFCPGSTVVVTRHALETVGPFDPKLRRLEDLDWFLRFALAGGRLEVAGMTGAAISIGRRARSSHVDEACDHLLKHRFQALEPKLKRRLGAYLHLERAAARRNDGSTAGMIYHLARSFAASPRRQLALRRWWTTADAKSEAAPSSGISDR